MAKAAKQITERLRAEDAARSAARGAALIHADALAEKERWKAVFAAIPIARRAMASQLLASSDMTKEQVIEACLVGASSKASEQPKDFFAEGIASAAALLGKSPDQVAALSPFANAPEAKPFDMALFEAGEASAKAILALTTGGRVS
jgi:hypothetical protein